MAKTLPLLPARPTAESLIVQRCIFLAKAHVWPHTSAIDARKWLTNFQSKEEKAVAYELLKAFMFFPERMTRELLKSAFQRIINHIINFEQPIGNMVSTWHQVVERMIIIPVRAGDFNPTESGYQYARLARNTFDLPEEKFPSITKTLLSLHAPLQQGTSRPIIVFVDDFVGSGEQFIKLWESEQEFQYGLELSFKDVVNSSGASVFYCPLIATSYGLVKIRAKCGEQVKICPAHIISDDYNALAKNSRVWSTADLQLSGPSILASIAQRFGMPEDDSTDDWRGYHRLGLGLVLHDSMPDACLGVLRFKENGWKPLFNKAR
jgi:hypothetical protein